MSVEGRACGMVNKPSQAKMASAVPRGLSSQRATGPSAQRSPAKVQLAGERPVGLSRRGTATFGDLKGNQDR